MCFIQQDFENEFLTNEEMDKMVIMYNIWETALEFRRKHLFWESQQKGQIGQEKDWKSFKRPCRFERENSYLWTEYMREVWKIWPKSEEKKN